MELLLGLCPSNIILLLLLLLLVVIVVIVGLGVFVCLFVLQELLKNNRIGNLLLGPLSRKQIGLRAIATQRVVQLCVCRLGSNPSFLINWLCDFRQVTSLVCVIVSVAAK